MKLQVHNLGRINEAELDIRPLTVFVGKNNTNKTWVAYALYGLLRNMTWRHAGIGTVRSAGPTMMKLRPDETRARIQSVVFREVDRLPVPQASDADTVELEVSRRELLEGVDGPVKFALDEKYLGKLLNLSDEISVDARVTLEITAEELGAREAKATLQVSYSQRSLRLWWEEPDPDVRLDGRRRGDATALRERAEEWLHAFAQRFLSLGLLVLLPAERETLVAAYKDMKLGDEVVLTQPPEAFVHFLLSTEVQWLKHTSPKMPEALELINKRILGGKIDFVEVGAGQRMVFIPEKGPVLPIHAASALVRSLAGLALYIQHGARPGDILIIDEPEMNAHPEAQIATTELLALLVNHGVHVIVTTHSPLILDHLNNLILAGRLAPKDQDEVSREFRLGTKECFLRPDQVAAYLFEADADESQIRVKSIFDPTNPWGEVDWDTFGDASIYVGNLKMQTLISRLADTE
jgi:hypothetical protein